MLKKVVLLAFFFIPHAHANPLKDLLLLVQDNLYTFGHVDYQAIRILRKFDKQIVQNKINPSLINWTNLIKMTAIYNDLPTIDDAILQAAHMNWNGILSVLIEKRKQQIAQPNQLRIWQLKPQEIEDALLTCCYNNNEQGALLLLKETEAKGDYQMINGNRPLYFAKKYNMKNLIPLLMQDSDV